MQRDTYIALGLLVLAALACVSTVYFTSHVRTLKAEREAAIEERRQSFTQQQSSVRTHAIAQDTASDRAKLDELLSKEIVAIAATLRSVGKTAGVSVRLGAAVPEESPKDLQGGTTIQAVGFALEGDGSFSALMRTIAVIESLPLASNIERFDIQRGQQAGAERWHMNIFIKVLTSSSL